MKIALIPLALSDYRTKPSALTYKHDMRTMLTRVRAAGYEGIEMGTPAGYSHVEYKELLEETGLAPVTVFGLKYPLEEGNLKEKITECKALGAANLMISNMPPVALGNPVELGRFIAYLNHCGKALMEEGGVTLSYHNHAVDFSRVNGKTIFGRIVEETDPRYVFLEPDTHWLQAGGAHVVTWLKRLEGRVRVVHFKDYGIDPYSDHTFLECTHKQFLEVGEGNLNWPAIIAECVRQGIPWCSVEQDKIQRPGYEAIALSMKNLRAFGVA